MAKQKDIDKEFEKKARIKINKTVRTITRNLMNELAQAGPVWTGDFRDSYAAKDVSTGAFKEAQFPYKLEDIPELPITLKELKRVKRISIINTAPHAEIAMDLVPGEFTLPVKSSPEGDVIDRGTRPEGGKRGEIGPKKKDGGDNRSTAPLDWYRTFVDGGKLERIMQKTVETTFIGEL